MQVKINDIIKAEYKCYLPVMMFLLSCLHFINSSFAFLLWCTQITIPMLAMAAIRIAITQAPVTERGINTDALCCPSVVFVNGSSVAGVLLVFIGC